MTVFIKRVYEEASPEDGYRALVDRLWPRGVSKEKASIDEWCKDIAPSNELRVAYHSGDLTWAAFVRLYTKELDHHLDLLQPLAERARERNVTLIYASKEDQHNHAAVLRDYLNAMAQ